MRSLHRLLAISILALPLIAAMPALAGNSQGNQDQNGQGDDSQGGRSWGGGAPEIDPGLLGGAVTLLAGGLLILRERRRG